MKVLFKLINIGIYLQALSIGDHAAQHELIILLHQETTFKDLLTLTHQLQSTNMLKHRAALKHDTHIES